MLDNCNQKSAYKIVLLKGYNIMTVDPEFANNHSVIGKHSSVFVHASLVSRIFRKYYNKQNLNPLYITW